MVLLMPADSSAESGRSDRFHSVNATAVFTTANHAMDQGGLDADRRPAVEGQTGNSEHYRPNGHGERHRQVGLASGNAPSRYQRRRYRATSPSLPAIGHSSWPATVRSLRVA